MRFTGYFVLYGLICTALSVFYYINNREDSDSLLKFIFSISVGIVLITILYSSIHFISGYQQFWSIYRKIIDVVLKIVQYVLVIVIHYGVLKTIYNDWAKSE